ncbi:hypothetical protein HPS54_00835 [Prevotella sp. PCHR]|uniref:Uncharacterized protein n=1 Tax=Xylanibacter caecicola TaxID=2736294 RepID=A0ABX2AYG5_9BACT|nr:hypothetical protein [Xylanibacter caecicola]NPE24073.1 hypothetical protein [Xylanibacter caecicola]
MVYVVGRYRLFARRDAPWSILNRMAFIIRHDGGCTMVQPYRAEENQV